MLVTTPEQKQRLREYGKDYAAWLGTEDGKRNIKEHREHERYFKERLSPERIDRMTESELSEVYNTLWASRIWSNKD